MEPIKLSKEVIRTLLLYEFELNHDAGTAAVNINRANGRQVVSERTAYRWFAKFREDNTDLNDQPKSGRPHEIDRDAVIEAIEENPTLTIKELAEDFDSTQMVIWKILKAAGKKWRRGNWILKELIQAQKNKRKKIARKLLRHQNRTMFLRNVVTIDEK